jgi:hypothetical protein
MFSFIKAYLYFVFVYFCFSFLTFVYSNFIFLFGPWSFEPWFLYKYIQQLAEKMIRVLCGRWILIFNTTDVRWRHDTHLFLGFCIVLLCVFTVCIPCCDVSYDFRMKSMIGSSLPPVVCRRAHALLTTHVADCV